MVKIGRTFSQRIGKIFAYASDQRIIDAINIRNIRNIYTFSVIVCVFDLLSLVLFVAMNRDSPSFWRTFINVMLVIIACGVIAFLSGAMKQTYARKGTISNVKANTLVIFFYIVLSVWGILVDVAHYRAGDQMLTYYIVQFCFVCFVVMHPKTGGLLIILSFSALFFSLYRIDGAAGIQPQNYIIFTLIAVLGNAIQHMMLQESEKSKTDVLELNEILKHEASVDELTKVKNRNALRNDFDKHIGQTVYTIMADVDSFKSYNDRYGHVMGDTVLRLFASATMEAFHDADTYRYGGDEFLIILAGCTDEEFEQRIHQWTEAIHAIQLPNIAQSIACSYGYEQRMLKSVDDLRNAIKIADGRLYEAKKAKTGDASCLA